MADSMKDLGTYVGEGVERQLLVGVRCFGHLFNRRACERSEVQIRRVSWLKGTGVVGGRVNEWAKQWNGGRRAECRSYPRRTSEAPAPAGARQRIMLVTILLNGSPTIAIPKASITFHDTPSVDLPVLLVKCLNPQIMPVSLGIAGRFPFRYPMLASVPDRIRKFCHTLVRGKRGHPPPSRFQGGLA